MKSARVEIKPNQILIHSKKNPSGIRLFLVVILILNTLSPILGLVYKVSEGAELHIGYFIAIGISWLIGFFLLRIILWNAYGREVFGLSSEGITYLADYKWFKDSEKRIEPSSDLQVFANTEDANDGFVRLLLRNSEQEIQSVLDITQEDFIRINDAVNQQFEMIDFSPEA